MDDRTATGSAPSPDGDPPPLPRRKLRREELIALDGLAATAFILVILVLTVARARSAQPMSSVPIWVLLPIVAGCGLPLAVRRLWPLPVFGVVLVMSVLSLFFDMGSVPFFATAFALYPVALTRPGRRWEPTLAIGILSSVGVFVLTFAGAAPSVLIPYRWMDELGTLLFGAAVMGGAWTVGRVVRERRAYAARSAAWLASQAVTEERLRIARELHDIVAHSMGLIVVKAGVANHVLRARPEEAHDALRVIETTGRSALTEMRHMLGVLRSEGSDTEAPADLGPVPGLSGLPELTERAAMAGVHVDLDVRGVDELPAGVDLTAYRIVQEALTNVSKHAAPARCRVTVEADGTEVRIGVTDDGPGVRVLPGRGGRGGEYAGGHGLVGMRERVTTYGGEFHAGPDLEGGFRVFARLPLVTTQPGTESL